MVPTIMPEASNFSGIGDDMNGTVKFIIRTEDSFEE